MHFATTIFTLAILAVSTQAIETASSGDGDAAKLLVHPGYPKYHPVRPYRPPPRVFPRSDSLAAAAAPQDQGESKLAINSEDMDYEDENALDEAGNDKFVMPYPRRRMRGRRPYWYRPYRYRRRYWY
ncbi:hypothetical protein BGZ70_006653 [Mortierella alpina]|uniref:Uncharacterized protein n=1 Tax=Mortierella alpina TaxID=64518 RepID=A0A9P6JEN4_MORAP|nr:hypothetical protein BGZ70_006653 [Mortierella alpina]